MATKAKPKKRRRRRTSTLSAAAPRKRRKRTLSAAPRRRRKRGMSAGGSKGKLMQTGKVILGGAAGGLLYNGHRFIFTSGPLVKGLIGIGIGGTAAYFGAPSVGAGAIGAMTTDLMNNFFSLKDMADEEWVDASTLQDTGMSDDNGESIMMDDDGVVYALNDDGDYEAFSDVYSLAENTSNIQGISNVPLADAWSLSANPWALSENYAMTTGY